MNCINFPTILILISTIFLVSSNFNNDTVKSKTYRYLNSSAIDASTNKEDIKLTNRSPNEFIKTLQIFNYEISSDYELNYNMKSYLDKLSEFLMDNPEVTVLITGHSDNSGSFDQNLYRSQKRAAAAADYLSSKGISSERIFQSGKGSLNPCSPNEGEESLKKNRRIEIQILK